MALRPQKNSVSLSSPRVILICLLVVSLLCTIIYAREGESGVLHSIQNTCKVIASPFSRVGNSIDEESANAIISNLLERKIVAPGEAKLMRSAVARNALALPVSTKDVLRAPVFRNMLVQVFRNLEEAKGNDV